MSISSIPASRSIPTNGVRVVDPSYWQRPRGVVLRLRGLGAAASSSPFVQSMAQAIAQQEGYGAPNSACTAINNPGCLRAGPGQTGTSAQGFAIFPDASTGWNALDSQIQYNIGLGLNMQQFFGGQPGVYPGYAPSADANNPTAYASNIATWTGVNDTTTPLSQLQAAYDSGGTFSTQIINPPSAIDSSGSIFGDLGLNSDYTPYIFAGIAVVVILVFARR